MDSISHGNLDNTESGANGSDPAGKAPPGGSRRAVAAVRQALRATVTQLSLLNHQVGGQLEMRPGDLYCLDLIDSHGPVSPSALSRMAGLHPATMTGILDRLERGRWVERERDPADRRGVRLRVLRERRPEIARLYAGMNDAVDRICAGYTPAELDLIAGFLAQATEAGRTATEDLSRS
jgi:DNA-binding MarR family transcriptional regulator